MTKPDMILWSSDARGVYIPQHFAESVRRDCLTGVAAEDLDILNAGPEHEHYWEAWTAVLDNAVITDPETGAAFHLYQDGDLWAVPDGMEWCDETDGFVWPEETDG